MSYRAYLRTANGEFSEKTITSDVNVAAEAFSALVNRIDLDGQKLVAALTYKNRQLCFHRFDRASGDAEYWRDRLDEIPWPSGLVGRPRTMEGGKRIQIYLDIESLKIAKDLGDGNISDGIRKALKTHR